MTIKNILTKYYHKIDSLDLELLIAHTLKKSREFVLAHPEARVAPKHALRIKNYANRRRRGAPLAYILGHKEFYGLDFKVNQHTLIPRPETELLVELALKEIPNTKYKIPTTAIIDVGTGSGNIIISMASQLKNQATRIRNYELFGVDISAKALQIAKHNARQHAVEKKIKFHKGSLLNPLLKNKTFNLEYSGQNSKIIILANLPYLSQKIYSAAAIDVKKYEPRSALFSAKHGLAHYEKLLQQIKQITASRELQTVSYFEISPEQKSRIVNLVKKYFPAATIEFHKDLAGKWRVCAFSS